MGSLTLCIKKAGTALNAEDKAAILTAAAAYRKQGLGATDAGRKAVDERIAAVQAMLDAPVEVEAPVAAPVATGKPVTLFYSRNTESAKGMAPAGMDMGQDIEPAGQYMNVELKTELKPPTDKWEAGRITFKNPLVLPHKSTDSKGWKKDLSDRFGGKTGKALTAAIKEAGHDGVITWDADGLSETVNIAGTKDAAAAPAAEPAPPPAQPEAEQGGAPEAQGVVENFGEELPPARRNMAAKLDEDLSDDDIAKRPLSEIWPLAENEAIEDNFAAAVAHAARAEIPAKPRVAYKVRQWVNKVKGVRGLAAHVLSGRLTRERLMEEVKGPRASLKDWASKVMLLERLPREKWNRIGSVEERPDAFTYNDKSERIPTPMVRIELDGKAHWLTGDQGGNPDDGGTVDGNMRRINELLGDQAPEKLMQFEVRGSGPYKINKKGDPEYRTLKTFPTTKEAFAFIKDQYGELVAEWEQIKARDNITERDLRSADNRPRAGKDHRGGKDVTTDEFEKQFGFRGGEWGKWVGQGKGAKERQALLNSAYDALMDLSDIVGIPPRAISLNGTLGIAFGSRGTGWASAHFEPDTLVINLTKTRGAGSLAHEWLHAVDNYFARMRRNGEESPFTGDKKKYENENFITHRPEALMVRKDRARGYPALTAGQLEARRERRKNDTRTGWPPPDAYDADKWERDPATPEGVRPEVEARFVALVEALNDSPMTKRAVLLDKGKSSGYWSSTLERAARAFESFVIARMHENGYHNDFLVNVKKLDETGKAPERYPYLLAGEVKPIADAFDALFGEIQTRTDEAGNVAMFSRAPAAEAPDAWIYRFWSSRTWESEADARDMMRRRIVEDNERYAGMFKPNDPALVDGLTFVKAPKGQVKLKQPKTPASPFARIGEPADSDGTDRPRVDWESTDLNDDGTPESVLQAYGRGHGNVYRAWVNPSDIPAPKGGGIVNGYPDMDGDYDWSELQRGRGAPPPLKLRVGKNGKLVLMDGNHRLAWWREQGVSEVPAYVIDERPEAMDVPFSRRAGRGITLTDARAVRANIRAALPKAPSIIIHESVDAAPKELRDQIYAAGAEADVEAAYHEGEIHVFPQHIASLERMEFVVGHHEIRHYGVRAMLGKDYGPVLLGIAKRNPALLAAARAKQDAGLAKTLVAGVDEALADMPAEDIAALTGIDRLISRIRQFLRDLAASLRDKQLFALADAIDPKAWTDKDVAHFVYKLEDISRRGAPGATSVGGTVFSEGMALADDPFWRKIRDGSEFTDEEKLDALSNSRRGVRRTGRILERGAGRPGAGETSVRWDAPIGRESSYTTRGAWVGQTAFAVGVQPGGVQGDDLTDTAGVLYTFGQRSDGTYSLSISDTAPGSAAREHLESTGQLVAEGTDDNSYARWEIGTKNSRALLQEAVRRLAMAIGRVPTVVEEGRETGARAGTDNVRVFRPAMIESRFSRAPAEAIRDAIPQAVQDRLTDAFTSQRGFNRWWHRTVGTQLHKAKINKEFGRVYYAVQDFMKDVSRIAAHSADAAPDMLPQIESLKDIIKKPAAKKDMRHASNALFDGTLRYKRDEQGNAVQADEDELGGLVWTDAELRERGASPEAIKLYRQARTAIDKSLDNLLAADIHRMLSVADQRAIGRNAAEADALLARVRRAAASSRPQDAVRMAESAIEERIATIDEELEGGNLGEYAVELQELRAKMADMLEMVQGKAQRIEDLQNAGYAPLMRFGQYTVDAVDGQGKRVFFGMYESQMAANTAAWRFREQGLQVSQGVQSKREFELLKGLSPETAKLFAEMLGVEKNEAMQEWLKNAVAEQSALKRHIRRKGIEGFDDDASRVLAAFITSNARAASRALHSQRIQTAVENVRQGDVKDEAIALADYVNNPVEEAQAIRSLLFVQYIGGSMASAAVNMTQTLVQTLPFLAQYGGVAKATARISAAMKQAIGKIDDDELAGALKQAEADGVIKPQEVFQLQAEASRTLSSNIYVRKALAAWGALFQLAEQYNRRVAFIAAYQTAKQEGIANPFAFAENAVDETQSVFNKGNRPNWSRGAVGATLFTFKTFTIQYLEFLSRLPMEQRLLALAMLVLLSGARGLPFAEDGEDIVDTVAQSMGYNWTTKDNVNRWLVKTIGQGWADFVQQGFSGISGVPLDVSQRLGMADLLPATGVLKPSETRKEDQVLETFGVAGSAVRDLLRGEVRPLAIRNVAKAVDMMDLEMYRDTRGRKITETDTVDAVLKGMGFQPANVAREQRAVGREYEKTALYRKVKSDITERMALGRFERDMDKVQEAREALRRWNEQNPEARINIDGNAVLRRVNEMRKSRSERFISSTPKDIRRQTAEALQ